MTLQHVGLVLYHSIRAFLESPLFGGYGPALALVAYLLAAFILCDRYERSLALKHGTVQASKISSWPATFFFAIGLLAVVLWINVQ